MAFVYRSPKNLEVLPDKNDNMNYNIAMFKYINDNSQILKTNSFNYRSIPFLSNTDKLINKVEETPGPGHYNIDNNPENFIHKQYIKNNKIKYKDSLYDFYSLVNCLDIKKDKKSNPEPGEYNPGMHELYGANIKNKNYQKNYKSISLYSDRFPKINLNTKRYNNKYNKINNNISDNCIKINPKYKSTLSIIYKDKLNSHNDNLNLTKRVQNYTLKELFKNVLLNHKLRNQKSEKNNSSILKDSLYVNETNNISLDKSNNNLNNTVNNYTNKNSSKKVTKPKNYKLLLINNRIKENKKNKTKINTELQENIYYLNEFINSKYFSQVPGPGYYFSKPLDNTKIHKNSFNYSTKSQSKSQIMNNANKTIINKLNDNIVLLKENINKNEGNNNHNFKKSKSINELKSDFIRKISEKEKQVYLKKKQSSLLNKLILLEKLKEKERKNANIKKKNSKKEIQNYSFNSNELRFKGPFGYQNELYKNNNPGPGEYDVFGNNCISKKNANIMLNELKKKLLYKDEFKDRKLFIDEIKDENPPVGSYQSHFLNTIEFNNKMKNIKWLDKSIKNGCIDKIQYITERRVKNMKLEDRKSKSMLGPFSYFKNIERKIPNYNENISFGTSIEKNKKNSIKKSVGPGDYNIDLNKKWVKKTYNALFV